MPVLAPVSLAIGVLSIVGFVAPAGLVVAIIGVAVGTVCYLQIKRSAGELGGKALAVAGLVLSSFFLLSGSGLHAYTYATEVPEGYERMSFAWLARQEPVVRGADFELHPDALALDGKKVFVKGYMYPTRQQTGITRFVLCKDTGECCFGGQPKITDMIVVNMQDGLTVDHREQQLVGVAGVFRARKVVEAGQVVALYSLEGYHFR